MFTESGQWSEDGVKVLNVLCYCRNLAGKDLGGNVTLDVSRFGELRALNLSSNALSGEIPVSIGECPSLEIL